MLSISRLFTLSLFFFFFFNATATPEIYTLSLHDALPIYPRARQVVGVALGPLPHRLVGVLLFPLPRQPRRLRADRSEEHTSELQSPYDIVCRLLLEKKKK